MTSQSKPASREQIEHIALLLEIKMRSIALKQLQALKINDDEAARIMTLIGDINNREVHESFIALIDNMMKATQLPQERQIIYPHNANAPSGKKAVKNEASQLEALRAALPDLKTTGIIYRSKDRASEIYDGRFVFPHWSTLGESYNHATSRVLLALKRVFDQSFSDMTDGQISSEYLIQTEKKEGLLENTFGTRRSHVILAPAQLGSKYQGMSAIASNSDMGDDEVGLGVYEIGIILLSHHDRIGEWGGFWIDCAGDYCRPSTDHNHDHTPYFIHQNGKISFGHSNSRYPHSRYGAASVFL